MGNLVGSNLWSPAVHQGAGGAGSGPGGPATAVTAYFVISEPEGKILKIMPDGTVHTWHTYAAALEPEGCMVDSRSQRLFVSIGNAGTRQMDRFDDLTGDDSGGSADATLALSNHGGNGIYEYGSDKVFVAQT
ncbi:hypothetical protein LCGC14_2612460, partial [marine sediment metagenome]